MVKRIAISIALAQLSSDYGKYRRMSDAEKEEVDELYDLLPSVDARRAWLQKYNLKDKAIVDAIKLISSTKPKDAHFFVSEDVDGIAKYIVYFDVKIEGKRHQVSFHTFNDLSKWTKCSVPSKGHWDHRSSRITCIKLLKVMA